MVRPPGPSQGTGRYDDPVPLGDGPVHEQQAGAVLALQCDETTSVEDHAPHEPRTLSAERASWSVIGPPVRSSEPVSKAANADPS